MSITKFLIVGTGFGGIEMAVALQKAGIDDFVMLEKGNDIGGVWRDNSYPGCSCDVPSHLYSFSFAPYKGREKRFPPQQDILAYLRQVATDFQLWPHIRLNAAVAQAAFQKAQKRWQVITASGEMYDAECVIFAVGQLHRPDFADIPGRQDFLGPKLHPAVWDHGVDLREKRIAIIGTGSSAAQMLPSLASVARSVTVYQRSPGWILPKPGSDFGLLSRWALRVPGTHFIYRKLLYYGADVLLSPVVRSRLLGRAAGAVGRYHLRRQVKDANLRLKLLPSYPIGSKRILFDSHFYPALTRSNVSLVTESITQITATGIETADGEHIAADIIVFATGFKASEFLAPISILGRDSRSLNEEWASGAEAFMGLAVHGYPNAFIIAGPNTFNPAGSNPAMKEVQVAYIMRCLRWKQEMGADAVEVKKGAMAGYREWLDGKMKRTIWPASVDSWYKHESGKVTNPWPASARSFARMMRIHPGDSFQVVGDLGKR
ncbi:putative monooxygenase [Lasiosphaeria hispida]|uniref:Monooxygenase n=1 Tax=Lasiosphaeria hispida TaxID=260671 RepID=A0AAJ0HL16_9PEZI|nr:putative monooxygenase [Lasiosphaeria hispida]